MFGTCSSGMLCADSLRRTTNPSLSRDAEGHKRVNQYRFYQTIGQGAFGKVKECEDVDTGRRHAVKIYRTRALLRKREFQNAGDDSDPNTRVTGRLRVTTALHKVYREISILQSLDSRHCVRLEEVLHSEGDDGKLYLVFELLEFGELMGIANASDPPRYCVPSCHDDCNALSTDASWQTQLTDAALARGDLAVGEPVDAEEFRCWRPSLFCEALARCFVQDIAQALTYLHSAEVRVAHRDVKPDNMFFGSDGHVKLGDFGVASRMDEKFRVRGTEGTYPFLPPECCRVEDSAHRPYVGHDGRSADVWALGVSLWVMLVGTLPVPANSLEELFNSIAECSAVFPEDAPLSAPGRDLLQRLLLCEDETRRITAHEILAHPWVEKADRRWAVSYADILARRQKKLCCSEKNGKQ